MKGGETRAFCANWINRRKKEQEKTASEKDVARTNGVTECRTRDRCDEQVEGLRCVEGHDRRSPDSTAPDKTMLLWQNNHIRPTLFQNTVSPKGGALFDQAA